MNKKLAKGLRHILGYNNEVIVYRVMMYNNPLLTVQAMYFTSKGQSVYNSTRG